MEFVQVESNADAREKVTMTALAGATEDLPDAVFLDRLNLMDLVEAGLLLDETEFLSPLVDKMVDGAVDEGIVQEKMYGLPDSVRPQLLMYNMELSRNTNKARLRPASSIHAPSRNSTASTPR